jgi:hypothetical protein
MAKTAQVLSSLNENFFDFFDFAVKQFCGSRIAAEAQTRQARKICGGVFKQTLRIKYNSDIHADEYFCVRIPSGDGIRGLGRRFRQ